MILLDDIQLFMVESVKASGDFQALCTSLLGEQLNYYSGSNVRRPIETLPYFAAYAFNYEDEKGPNPSRWIMQFVIALDASGDTAALIDGVWQYQTPSKIGQLSKGAIAAIENALCTFGIGGDLSLRVMHTNILVTEIGEADDIQAIVTLRLENEKYL